MSIRYLKNREIDIIAWDKCIAASFNSSVYAFSWYLDLVCENWDALVEDDYRSVMPLPKHLFFGKDIIGLPYFLNELGIFSITPVNASKTKAFIEAIPHIFAYYQIILNKYNPVALKDTSFLMRTRYELDLIKPYYKLSGFYSPGLQQQIILAMARGFSFIMGLSPNDMIRFIVKKQFRLPKALTRHNFRLLRSVMAGLIRYKSGELYGVYDSHNELASIGLFAWINYQINLIFHVVADDRLNDFAHLFLIDRFVDKYSETNTTLVFDSAIIPLPKIDYKDFGARETNHVEIIRNELPFPLNHFIHYPIFNTFFSSSQLASN
jgi:hypothetical protein